MGNAHFRTVIGVLALTGLVLMSGLLSAPARAAEAGPGSEREFGAKLLVCNACHGENGRPRNATTPIIWGQQENYLVKQIHDFQTGTRDNEVMAWMATTLTQAEVGPAVAYFAQRNWPAKSSGTPAVAPPASVALCQACHQPNFVGGAPAPRLAGQNYDYLVESMRRYADGERTNNAEMVSFMKAIPASEREQIARYIAGL
jgi:cytochrome c553